MNIDKNNIMESSLDDKVDYILKSVMYIERKVQDNYDMLNEMFLGDDYPNYSINNIAKNLKNFY